MHKNADKLLQKRFPCAIHKPSSDRVKKTLKMNYDFWKLWNRYNEMGMFNISYTWLAKTMILNFTLYCIMFYACYNYADNWFMNGILVGMVIHSGGFMTHDACHSYVCETQFWNKVCSWIGGDLTFGVSSKWWKDEHEIHHSIPNVYDPSIPTISDPQAFEDIWRQDKKVLNIVEHFYQPFVFKYQHYLSLPLVIILGRYGIIVDCWIDQLKKKRWRNLLGFVLHWCWVITLMRWQTNYMLFYFTFNNYQGLLSLQ